LFAVLKKCAWEENWEKQIESIVNTVERKTTLRKQSGIKISHLFICPKLQVTNQVYKSTVDKRMTY